MLFINLNRDPHRRSALHRCRSSKEARLVGVADIARLKEMVFN
jgi:hypothetical protein